MIWGSCVKLADAVGAVMITECDGWSDCRKERQTMIGKERSEVKYTLP